MLSCGLVFLWTVFQKTVTATNSNWNETHVAWISSLILMQKWNLYSSILPKRRKQKSCKATWSRTVSCQINIPRLWILTFFCTPGPCGEPLYLLHLEVLRTLKFLRIAILKILGEIHGKTSKTELIFSISCQHGNIFLEFSKTFQYSYSSEHCPLDVLIKWRSGWEKLGARSYCAPAVHQK